MLLEKLSEFRGGDLGMEIGRVLRARFPKVRSRVDTLGYLPRGFVGLLDPTDQQEAHAAGVFLRLRNEIALLASVGTTFATHKTGKSREAE